MEEMLRIVLFEIFRQEYFKHLKSILNTYESKVRLNSLIFWLANKNVVYVP